MSRGCQTRGPKGPHIVHLSTMCHLFEESAKVDICLLISPKNKNLVEDVKILLPVKFCWIPFSGFRGEVEKVSANQRPGRQSCFSNRPKKHKLGRGRWDLASYKFRWIPFSGFRDEVENVSANQRPGRPSCFPIDLKNTNLVEDVEILLPVKFRWIPFCGFRGEVENVKS